MSAVIIITGAADGLGWALAQGFHQRGDQLLLADRNEGLLRQRAATLASEHGVQVVAGDICDASVQDAIIATAIQHFGRIDVLINNAGITHRSRVQDTDTSVYTQVMAIDWQAPVQLAVKAREHLRTSRGSVINIGSMAGWMPVPGRAGYCAAKAALSQFFEVFRLEEGPEGVHVLNVYPSFLDTSIEKNALAADGEQSQRPRSTIGQIRGPDWMAGRIIKALDARKPWLFPDRLSRFGAILWRLWPAAYLRMVRRQFAVELEPDSSRPARKDAV